MLVLCVIMLLFISGDHVFWTNSVRGGAGSGKKGEVKFPAELTNSDHSFYI